MGKLVACGLVAVSLCWLFGPFDSAPPTSEPPESSVTRSTGALSRTADRAGAGATRSGGSPAPGLDSGAPLPGEKYALLVGVRDYGKNSGLRDLRFPEQDVEALAEVFTSSGFRPENVMVMTQSRGARESRYLPLRSQIVDELDVLLRDRSTGDTVVLAFAGHGVQFRNREDQAWFCPMDARLDEEQTLLSLSSVYDQLDDCSAGSKLLLNDACRNDPVASSARTAGGAADSVTRLQIVRPPGGIAAMYSCSPGEVAFEDEDLGHGVFFHYVIEGLKGTADYDKDERISLPELEMFAKRRVSDYVRAEFDGARQMPHLINNSRGLITLIDRSRPEPEPDPTPVSRESLPEPAPAPPEPPASNRKPQKLITNSIGMKLRLIPAGEFEMGSAKSADELASVFDTKAEYFEDEFPRHRVRITQPFYLQTTEVTQGQWESVMGTTPWSGKSFVKEGSDYAASYVSWEDAVEFCRKLSAKEGREYRLPTEAEWEYVCRAGNRTMHSFGDSPSSLSDYAWWGGLVGDGNAKDEKYAHRVSRKRPNAWGLYDMHGNVYEWCSDWYGEDYYGSSPLSDPQGPSTGSSRVRRGGSWIDPGRYCRSALRFRDTPEYRSDFLGFRLAAVQSR